MSKPPRPVALIILDGWGTSDELDGNAIAAANTPVMDALQANYPNTLIDTSGAAVGLPGGQMGNSEVGHMNLGSGRVVYQEFTRVSRSIRTGSFFQNRTLTDAVDLARDTGKQLHVLGMLSPGGVHSHEDHIHAMLKLAAERGLSDICLHAIVDGRDMPPKSAEPSLCATQKILDDCGCGRIASLIGRYYAMDRDNRWKRIEAAYDLFTQGIAEFEATDVAEALAAAYARGETDEFVQATRIVGPGQAPVTMNDGDVLVFMNFRSDRARQISRPFVEPGFDGFKRKVEPALARFVSLTEYNKNFDIPVAFPPERLTNVFGEYMASLGMRQLRIAETEKYAHVTFFFNGGREEPFDGEDRILVPSPDVATYDLQPEMSAPEVTDKVIEAVESGRYDAIILNYANADMVGHTGNFDAAVKAVETLDTCVGRVVEAMLAAGGELLITADHGNAEQMLGHDTGQPHTAHTANLVPLYYIGTAGRLNAGGALCDIAPTLLELMQLPQPTEMTGHSLLVTDAG